MHHIFTSIAALTGIASGAFFLAQPLIILFFGIPFTSRLHRLGLIQGRDLIIRYCGSTAILLLLFLATSAGINSWWSNATTPYWSGVIFAILYGIKNLGPTQSNMKDYLESNVDKIDTAAFKIHFPQYSCYLENS